MARQGPERTYTTRLVEELRKLPTSRWIKVGPGPYQEAGLPDLIGCVQGRFIAIEVKVKGNRPTEKQAAVLASLNAAGSLTLIVFAGADPRKVITVILERLPVQVLRSA